MKKIILYLFSCAATLILITLAQAQSSKMITLKDGSILKGSVAAFENNVYTIETPNLGQLQIPDSEIITISDESAVPSQNTNPSAGGLQSEVQALQGTLLSDPEILNDMQKLMEDESIRAILADPNFVQDIMSYDPSRIENNSQTQKLMENPEMKALMEKIQSKMENK